MLADGLFEVLAGLGSAAVCADVLPGPVQDFVRHVIDARLADGSGGGHQLGFCAVRSRAIGSRLAGVDPRHGKHLLAIGSVFAAVARIGSASLQGSLRRSLQPGLRSAFLAVLCDLIPAASLIGAAVGMLLAARCG